MPETTVAPEVITPEPETPQADPAAHEAAGDQLALVVTPPVVTTTPPDPIAVLREQLRAEFDVLADAMSTLTCHLIDAQLTAYRERKRALKMARDRGPRPAAKVTVSTLVTLPVPAQPDMPATDAAPEPPDKLAEIASQVAEQVMCSERAQIDAMTKTWSDDLTLAHIRAGWPQFSPDQRDSAARLLDELCKPPHQRGPVWFGLIRAAKDGIELTPAEASPSKKEGDK